MKFLMFILLLAAAFLVGYHMGHQPGSPDVMTMAKEKCQQLVDLGSKATANLAVGPNGTTEAAAQPAAMVPDEFIKIAGKVYRIGPPQPADGRR